MFDAKYIAEMLIWIPPILFALTVHEFMHGYAAYKLGDPTAKNAGRLTLNPLAHLDPFGTIMLIIAHFGWAKPVPVNPVYFRNPRRDMMIVSVAGPASNFALAFITGCIFILFRTFNIPMHEIFYRLLRANMDINVILMAFNLLPIPPLDGSKIMFGLFDMSPETQYKYSMIGPKILLGIILLGVFTRFSIFSIYITPFIIVFHSLFL